MKKNRKSIQSCSAVGNNNNKRSNKSVYAKSSMAETHTRKYPDGALPDIIRPDKKVNTVSGKSGASINDVNTALYDSNLELPISFEEALESVKTAETLAEGESIIYIGRGDFAVVRYETKNNKEIMHIVRKIEFECKKDSTAWRDLCSYDLSTLDIKNPGQLSDLYTEEEKSSFSRFNGV